MLGEQYGELKGKVIGQRVLDVEGPTIETSVSANGTIKGVSVQEMITFIGTPTAEKGIIHGVGKGSIINYRWWWRTRNGTVHRRGDRKS
jgi:hypothetical protein